MARRPTERGERKKLQRELAEHLRKQDKARLRDLRSRIHQARIKRQADLTLAREHCRQARESFKLKQQLEREELRDQHRGERAEVRSSCAIGKSTAKERGRLEESAAQQALREERRTQRDIAYADKRGKLSRSTARERAEESDDAVRRNIPAELVPVFDKVRRKIKGGPRKSRTEDFLQWAEENPGEIVALQQAEADEYLRKLIKEQREHGQAMRKAGRYRQTPDELTAELLRQVPF